MSTASTAPATPPPAELLDAAGKPIGPLAAAGVARILAAAKACRDDPNFEEFLRAVEEYRREHNTPPDVD